MIVRAIAPCLADERAFMATPPPVFRVKCPSRRAICVRDARSVVGFLCTNVPIVLFPRQTAIFHHNEAVMAGWCFVRGTERGWFPYNTVAVVGVGQSSPLIDSFMLQVRELIPNKIAGNDHVSAPGVRFGLDCRMRSQVRDQARNRAGLGEPMGSVTIV